MHAINELVINALIKLIKINKASAKPSTTTMSKYFTKGNSSCKPVLGRNSYQFDGVCVAVDDRHLSETCHRDA